MNLDLERLKGVTDIGSATHQVTETITVTARAEETLAELRTAVGAVVPGFRCQGGMDRIRKGDSIPLGKGRTYDFDRQAHVVFVCHHPRQSLNTGASPEAECGQPHAALQAAPASGITGDQLHEIMCSFEDRADVSEIAAKINAALSLPNGLGGALADIAAERRRQVEVEGWSVAHDDEHTGGEMAKAAACYAAGRIVFAIPQEIAPDRGAAGYRSIWPWDLKWWKPKSYRLNLIRAAALLVAEIERLDRRAALSASAKGGVHG